MHTQLGFWEELTVNPEHYWLLPSPSAPSVVRPWSLLDRTPRLIHIEKIEVFPDCG